MVSGHWKDHRAVWESKSSAGLIVPAQATCNLPACDSPPNYPPVQPHCYPPVLILLLPIIICHWAKLSSRPAHHSARHHLRLWKAITKTKPEYIYLFWDLSRPGPRSSTSRLLSVNYWLWEIFRPNMAIISSASKSLKKLGHLEYV